jgi:hypothetical protein
LLLRLWRSLSHFSGPLSIRFSLHTRGQTSGNSSHCNLLCNQNTILRVAYLSKRAHLGAAQRRTRDHRLPTSVRECRMLVLTSRLLFLVCHDLVLQARNRATKAIFSREWESWLFSSSPYDPLSETRIKGDRVTGTRFFEDMKARMG